MSDVTKLMPTTNKVVFADIAVHKEDNRYGEDVYLLYNPDGYGGVIAVGEDIIKMMRSLDGTKTIVQVVREAGLQGEEASQAIHILHHLLEIGILVVDGFKPKFEKSNKRELSCWLHLTNDCNLRCRYCYIHKTHDSMPDCILYQSIDKMIASCKQHHYSNLALMLVGGEPLMRFDVIQSVIQYCSKKAEGIHIRYVIPTNGTLITPSIAKWIVANNIDVGVSIDGIEEYHDKNRVKANGKGSYYDAMRGIDNLIAEGYKPSIMLTVTNENIDGLPSFTKLMIEKELRFRFSFERDTQTGHPAILDNQEHVIEKLKECFDIMKQALIENRCNWRFKFGDVSFGKPYRRACSAGYNFFAVGQDGSIGSCSIGLECTRTSIGEMQDVIADIRKVFSDLATSSVHDAEECRECVWRHSCSGACPLQTYATYGTFSHASPYCELYRECLPDVIRIYAMTIYFRGKAKEV